MTTIAPICDKCGNTLIAAESSEYVSDGLVFNFWCCPKCRYRFETEAYMPVDTDPNIDRAAVEPFFPSLSVA